MFARRHGCTSARFASLVRLQARPAFRAGGLGPFCFPGYLTNPTTFVLEIPFSSQGIMVPPSAVSQIQYFTASKITWKPIERHAWPHFRSLHRMYLFILWNTFVGPSCKAVWTVECSALSPLSSRPPLCPYRWSSARNTMCALVLCNECD